MSTLTPNPAAGGGVLPGTRNLSANQNAPAGIFGELLISEAAARYHALVKSGVVFSLSAPAVNPAAFTGGAQGTPVIGLFNPASSGKDLVILQARVAIRATGSAAASASLNFWQVNQGGVAVTGAQTQARNMYSQSATGSVAYGMVNTANTASLSSTLTGPSISLQAVAAAAQGFGQLLDPVDGAIIVSPGGYLAYGQSAALTAGSLDVALIWAEVPV